MPRLRILWMVVLAHSLLTSLVVAEEPEVELPPPVFIQVCMGDEVPSPAGIHLFGRYDRPFNDQHYVPHSNLTRRGLFRGANTGLKDKQALLSAGDCTGWIEISELLPPKGSTSLSLDAVIRYREYLPRVSFTVELAHSEFGPVVASFRREGSGAGLVVRLDRTKLAEAESSVLGAARVLEQVQALAEPPGQRPRRFPILTGLQLNQAKAPGSVVEANLTALARLGFSGIAAPGLDYESLSRHGFAHHTIKGYLQSSWCEERCWMEPKWSEFERGLGRFADKAKALKLSQNLNTVFWTLGDEYSSRRLTRMRDEALYHPHFHAFLRERGYQPSDFGAESWEGIKPLPEEDRLENPLLFYLSCRFRPTVFSAHMRHGTRVVHQHFPELRTTQNFAESLTYHNNMLYRGVDWFENMKNSGMGLGWTETWVPYVETSQIATYHFFMLQAACRRAGVPWGAYVIVPAGEAWDAATKALSGVGHGASVLSFYNYGPAHNGSHDTWSSKPERFQSIQRATHLIGAREEELLASKPRAARAAIYYSHASDMWHLHESSNPYGAERKSLLLLLQHLGLPVDAVIDEQVTSGALDEIDLLFLVDAHVDAEAMQVIQEWVRAGGTLYTSAGSARFDHLNREVDGLRPLGIERGELVVEGGRPWRALLSYHAAKSATTVTHEGAELNAIYMSQPLQSAGEGLATDADGASVVATVRVGEGAVRYMGALPGLSYRQPAAVERRRFNKEVEAAEAAGEVVPDPPSINSRAFDAGWRELMGRLLRPYLEGQVVRLSDPLVEGRLLEGPEGLLLVLANWAGEARDVEVRIVPERGVQAPEAVAAELRELAADGNGWRFRVRLEEGDILRLPWR